MNTKFIYIEAYTNPTDGANRQVANNIQREVTDEVNRLYRKYDINEGKEIYVMDTGGLLDGIALVVKKEIIVDILTFLIESSHFSDMSVCEIASSDRQDIGNNLETSDEEEDDSGDWWKS